MAESWAQEEMSEVDLQDRRLNARIVEVLSQLGGRPTASIPAACGGHAEMTAAYRLFNNENVSFERIMAPHAATTRRRVAAQKTVVLVQDTTEADLTRPDQQVAGAGPLDAGARRGVLLHPLHAFCEDGTPLGTLHAVAWTRPDGDAPAALSGGKRAAIPIEQKESFRWIEMLRHAHAEARRSPATHMICVADSEADIYEFFAEAHQSRPDNADWIVRSCQNRTVQAGQGQTVRFLGEQALAQPVLFTQRITVRGRKAKVSCEKRARRQPRQSRQATVEVRAAARVILRPPWRPPDRRLDPIMVNVVLVREVNPPVDDEPVEWLLLTSLPVEDAGQVGDVIRLYCVRWMIEVFFRVLKSGCRVEERRFERIDRFESCLAIYLIVAWRTLYVCRLGRACPQIDCEAIFDPAEWKAVWTIAQRSPPPPNPPPLGEMILLVAQLGGYVRRKNSPPGPQTIWLGLQRTHDFALCWNQFGPETRKDGTFV